jgi:hypothetical protein
MATGVMGIAYHLSDFSPKHPFEFENVWILLVRITAIVSGAFMLRGSNWARWLSLAWIAFHLILSFFHSLQEVVVHGSPRSAGILLAIRRAESKLRTNLSSVAARGKSPAAQNAGP